MIQIPRRFDQIRGSIFCVKLGPIQFDRHLLLYSTDAHYLSFRWRSAVMTAALPWMLPRATVDIRGFPRQGRRLMVLPRQMPRLWTRHVPRFRPWQIRGTNHGNPRKSATHLPQPFPRTSNHSNFHGHPRPSAAIATAILRYAAIATEARGNCHVNFRGRQTNAISTAIRGNPPIHGNCHGSPRQSSQQFPRHSAAIRGN